MKLGRIACTVSAIAFVAGCDCCGAEPFERLAPFIAVGDPFDPAFSVCSSAPIDAQPNDFFRDCAFDFGEVDIGRARVFSFTIRNPSPVKLQVASVGFLDGSDPAFAVDGVAPEEVAAGVGGGVGDLGTVVSVKFQPTVEGAVSAQLIIKSDGENLDDNGDGKIDDAEQVVINLTANGVSRCKPKISMSPAACNFGDVGVGATAFCDLSINNDGECELVVSDLDFSDDTPFPTVFGPQGNFQVPTTVPGGTGVSLRLYARPQDTSLTTGTLIISSFDPENPTVEVPLSVQGANAPTCVARVSKVNGAAISPNDAAPAIEPLDDVEFSSDQSQSARAGGVISNSEWSIIAAPAESSATLTNTTGTTTRFHFSSASGNVNAVDVAGTFTLGLVVTDDLGAVSTQCQVTINAVPREGLHVQLTWDQPNNDIDLHLARNGINWCSTDDCYFAGTTRNWGGGNKNPSLDIDDLEGFGPENINIEAPDNGDYTVGVGMYTHDSDATITVKIFVGGQLEFEGFHLLGQNATWVPARVEVRGGISTVVEIDDSSREAGTCWGGF